MSHNSQTDQEGIASEEAPDEDILHSLPNTVPVTTGTLTGSEANAEEDEPLETRIEDDVEASNIFRTIWQNTAFFFGRGVFVPQRPVNSTRDEYVITARTNNDAEEEDASNDYWYCANSEDYYETSEASSEEPDDSVSGSWSDAQCGACNERPKRTRGRVENRRARRRRNASSSKRQRQLLKSGEFGVAVFSRRATILKQRFCPSRNIVDKLYARESAGLPSSKASYVQSYIPSGGGTILETYKARAYTGQFSNDGMLFYTCSQDYILHLYDTTDTHRFRRRKAIRCHEGRWTITDAALSPDNGWLCYSSITPMAWLADIRYTESSTEDHCDPQREEEGTHIPLNFSECGDGAGDLFYGGGHFGLWSVRFSGNGKEIVAGASDAKIYVYDIEMKTVRHRICGHDDDVNAVCFADRDASNVLFSGSDDNLVKVWDRRSMGRNGSTPSGVLVGHSEGVTYVASKGDGRYCLSNGKDQAMKLWDIRMMYSPSQFNELPRLDFRREWDYRFMAYPGNPRFRHPQDVSVATFHGHKVLKTLIRCGFSPAHTTGQAYMYSGSEDGRVHIYDATGTAVRILDVSEALHNGALGNTVNSQSSGRERRAQRRANRDRLGLLQCPVVRDVSWHPYEPVIVSTTWGIAAGASGSIVRHDKVAPVY